MPSPAAPSVSRFATSAAAPSAKPSVSTSPSSRASPPDFKSQIADCRFPDLQSEISNLQSEFLMTDHAEIHDALDSANTAMASLQQGYEQAADEERKARDTVTFT